MNKIIGDFDDDADGSISMAEWLERTETKFNEVVSTIIMEKLNVEDGTPSTRKEAENFGEASGDV